MWIYLLKGSVFGPVVPLNIHALDHGFTTRFSTVCQKNERLLVRSSSISVSTLLLFEEAIFSSIHTPTYISSGTQSIHLAHSSDAIGKCCIGWISCTTSL